MMIMEAEVPCCWFVGHQCKSEADISILSLWDRESNCNLGVCINFHLDNNVCLDWIWSNDGVLF